MSYSNLAENRANRQNEGCVIHLRGFVPYQAEQAENRRNSDVPPITLQMPVYNHYKSLPDYQSNPDYAAILQGVHTLIGGTTGSGKSVLLNSLLVELLGTVEPGKVGCCFIDPKRVELSAYRSTPYCMAYASDNPSALGQLLAVIDLIEDRYTILQEVGGKQWTGQKVYVVIDELADLLIDYDYGARIKRALQKIMQIGRASGVSVIACTQAPSRSVIPAAITLNFTERIGLRCCSAIESRQVINVKGCEQLARYGKGLWASCGYVKPLDIPLLQEAEQERIIGHWAETPCKTTENAIN